MSERRKHFGLLQIGPVQEFIQTAKKTVDYWSGSFILSYFCSVAINHIGKDKVIFPSVHANPLFAHASTHPLPWVDSAKEDVYRPSLPNRLFCQLDENLDAGVVLSEAKELIKEKWMIIQKEIFSTFPSQVFGLNKTWTTMVYPCV
jgi:CRISPR-associated protein Cmr2